MPKTTIGIALIFALSSVPVFATSHAEKAKTDKTKAEATSGAAAGQEAAKELSAELKVGLGIEKREITGEAESFSVAAGTKIYAWVAVTGGSSETKITVSFSKGDKEAHRHELAVSGKRFRTNAYKTFRAGDGGDWIVRVLSANGQELAKKAFKVEIKS